MPLIRPRLSDYYGLPITQTECDFAIPLLDEDIPLYVDPFLLWKSPSMQDNALHTTMLTAFDRLIKMFAAGHRQGAVNVLVSLSECDEAGLGSASDRKGRRIGRPLAEEALAALAEVPAILALGIQHIEILQLVVDGIGKDRVSDITCSLLKSFLVDYTAEQSRRHQVPVQTITIPEIFDFKTMLIGSEIVDLPISPVTGKAILFIPKRWLRYSPWISYDSYFEGGFIEGEEVPTDRVSVLLYNRLNYGLVQEFIVQRESIAGECKSDPLFRPISILSAKRRLASLRKLPSGNDNSADKQYEDLVGSLLTSMLHPQLDFASEQVRSESGVLVRDLIFYNSRVWDFLQDIHQLYDCRQLVFELKNVRELGREHVSQINRYMSDQFGRFGVLVTRSTVPRSIERNLVDLWAGQRRCIIVLTDEDIDLMVTLFESRQRLPIEVLKRSYVNFTRRLPS